MDGKTDTARVLPCEDQVQGWPERELAGIEYDGEVRIGRYKRGAGTVEAPAVPRTADGGIR